MVKDPRERAIRKVSYVGVVSNTFLGVVKVVIGITTGSVAILTDAVNNLTDTASSFITIIGTHLANRHPDMKHPFGFGRVEYLTSLVIGLIVFFTGVEMCRTSIVQIIHPKAVHITWIAIAILVITIAVKIFLGQYTLSRGKTLDSDALKASGMDARSDAVATSAALVSALLNIWKGITIDAWVGALISLYIVYTGYTILKETISKMVGESVPRDFAAKIMAEVTSDSMVLGAYDLILNNYGPNRYIGSINVEVDYKLTAEQISRNLHELHTKIVRDYHTNIVIGIYAIDKDAPATAHVSELVSNAVKENPHILGFHGLYIDENAKEIFCDIVTDYNCDGPTIIENLTQQLQNEMPGYKVMLTLDTPYIQK